MDGKIFNLIAETVRKSCITGDATEVIACDLADLFEKEYDGFDKEEFLARCCQLFRYRKNKRWDVKTEQWVSNPDK